MRATVFLNSPRAEPPGIVASLADSMPALELIRQLPGYVPTPVVSLPHLARQLRLGAVEVKDEGRRFGLRAFKAVGAGYAVFIQIAAAVRAVTGVEPSLTDILQGRHASHTGNITLVCASAGNHGRAVAWAARLFHCRCRVYMSDSVEDSRAEAIRAEGAEVVRVAANYDSCVNRAAVDAAAHGWLVISDTAYADYTEVPLDIMRGYTTIVHEYLEVCPPPTHVFVQAGVGGLAAAVAASLFDRFGRTAPRVIIVEPDGAACYCAGLVRGTRTEVADAHSVMGGLACGVPSTLAWDVLAATASAAVSIPDSVSGPVMAFLAAGNSGDPPIHAGPSGCAGIAALMGSAADVDVRRALGLHPDSRVWTIVTES